MKKQFLFITSFCLITTITYSMDPNRSTKDLKTFEGLPTPLSPRSKNLLVQRARQDVLQHHVNYWPDDVTATLKGFYLLKDQYVNTDNPRYAVSLIGHFLVCGKTIRKDTTGWYHQKKLKELGVNLPQPTNQ